MQKRPRISLNAVRVFIAVAQRESIALAAETLSVTPGAVSHQLKRLENELGVQLFHRGNNAIWLTRAGSRFQEDCTPALAIIDRSVGRLRRNAQEIVIQVSMSLGMRWLIPALERFKKNHPDAQVRIEMTTTNGPPSDDPSDIVIYYEKARDISGPGDIIAIDLSQPIVSPGLLQKSGFLQSGRLQDLPALQCANGNWDWKLWVEKHGFFEHDIAVAHTFDTDDAAIRAAAAGLGMVLSPAFLTADELRTGALVMLPGFSPIELGRYKLFMHSEPGGMAGKFRDWLRQEISAPAGPGAS
jgi:LysR family glycine cleavage system transcriptional activator